ncbi:MAG: choice-of-anchor Q domain-containing protein, partial [Prosthecobacter sp.]
CTVAGNSCAGDGNEGGAIRNNGALTLTHCTLSGNSHPGSNDGIFNEPSRTIMMAHCILHGNTGGNDIRNYGTLNVTSTSIIGILTNSAAGTSSGTILTSNPLLAPLGNYGGPTQTIALMPGSSAHNAAVTSTITSDQRGFLIVGQRDIGAYEAGTITNYDNFIWETLPATATTPQHASTFDFDGDGQTNGDEWLARTDPGSASSSFRITQSAISGASFNVTFPTVSGRSYQLQSSPNLANPWTNIGSVTPGTGSNRTLPVTITGLTGYFFRVSVSGP